MDHCRQKERARVLNSIHGKSGAYDVYTSFYNEIGDLVESNGVVDLDEYVAKYKPDWRTVRVHAGGGRYHSNKVSHRLLEMAVCVIVSDHNNGQTLAKIDFEDQLGRAAAANLVTTTRYRGWRRIRQAGFAAAAILIAAEARYLTVRRIQSILLLQSPRSGLPPGHRQAATH